MLQKNKNLGMNPKGMKNESNNCKQAKKKHCIIKLQVNRLIKLQASKINSHKTSKSQFLYSHDASQQFMDPNRSVQKQVQVKQQKKITKTFEELYFQKLKELRLQQNNFLNYQNGLTQNSVSQFQKVRPNSCKNVVSIKKKNISTAQQPQSTKNANYFSNKQNIFVQKTVKYNQISSTDKFFKKKTPQTINNISLIKNEEKSIQKKNDFNCEQQSNKIVQQKGKKILKLKKPTKIDKSLDLPLPKQLLGEKQNKNVIMRNKETTKQFESMSKSSDIKEKSSLSPLNSSMNPSIQLKTFKASTPSSSAQKSSLLSFTQIRFNEVTQNKINHLKHQHIWGGTECFFSFQQFEIILQQLGHYDKSIKETGFYVQKLWQHLGGKLYGGVVRKNMRDFLNILVQENYELKLDSAKIPFSTDLIGNGMNFIDKGSLRLIKLDQNTKDLIRKLYYPFKINKSVLKEYNKSADKNQGDLLIDSNSYKVQVHSKISKREQNHQTNQLRKKSQLENQIQINELEYLENNAYLDSVKSRQANVSPCINKKANDDEINFQADFSPKMSTQQYEPFKSTILNNQLNEFQKKQSEQVKFQQEQTKPLRKPLLSVDVNLGQGILEKLLVYEDQNPYEVSLKLKQKYNIDEQLRQKFEKMLRNHLNTLLFKIQQVSQELFEDSVQLRTDQNQPDFILMDRDQY